MCSARLQIGFKATPARLRLELQDLLHRTQAERKAMQMELSGKKLEEADARRHATELQVLDRPPGGELLVVCFPTGGNYCWCCPPQLKWNYSVINHGLGEQPENNVPMTQPLCSLPPEVLVAGAQKQLAFVERELRVLLKSLHVRGSWVCTHAAQKGCELQQAEADPKRCDRGEFAGVHTCPRGTPEVIKVPHPLPPYLLIQVSHRIGKQTEAPA
eukprot:1149853-Pelagomonas_calceolata.AAC.5